MRTRRRETSKKRQFSLEEIPHEFLHWSIARVREDLAEYYDILGKRFTTNAESVEFAEADETASELPRKNRILVHGSSALLVDDFRYVPLSKASVKARILGGGWIEEGVLCQQDRLLLVSKDA